MLTINFVLFTYSLFKQGQFINQGQYQKEQNTCNNKDRIYLEIQNIRAGMDSEII